MSMTDHEACIALNMISGIGFVKYSKLLERFGTPAAVFEAPESEIAAVSGISKQLAGKIASFDNSVLVREMEIADRGGVRIQTLADSTYPEILNQLYDPPLALYVRGRFQPVIDKSLAVVGSRRISSYGERMTKRISEDAAMSGYTIVSGLALGVDAIAHSCAVEAGVPTIAVLGGGLLHPHPKENIDLARRIIDHGGAVISEFPLDFPVVRTNFPRRNRIVAGLARAVIVTEAGENSGALITARLALELGRDVFAVPGRVDNPQAKGCHRLIKEGAALIEGFEDVAAALGSGLLPGFLNSGEDEVREGAGDGSPLPSDLSELETAIVKHLEGGDASLEDLEMFFQIDTALLLAALMRLELKLIIELGSDQRYRLALKAGGFQCSP